MSHSWRPDFSVFEPQEARILSNAFALAWKRRGAAYQSKPQAVVEQAREKLAQAIIALGEDGERDVERLADLAIERSGV